MKNPCRQLAIAISLLSLLLPHSLQAESSAAAAAQSSAEAEANNPLANFRAFNIHNYYTPELSGPTDGTANTTWLRYAQPFGK